MLALRLACTLAYFEHVAQSGWIGSKIPFSEEYRDTTAHREAGGPFVDARAELVFLRRHERSEPNMRPDGVSGVEETSSGSISLPSMARRRDVRRAAS
jgi:hypothetical protein